MANNAVINFTRGIPAPESFPVQDLIEAAHTALDKYGEVILQYGKDLSLNNCYTLKVYGTMV
jgi:DNA-binding transcriptional MocR family regulator